MRNFKEVVLKHWFPFILCIVLLVATILRFYQLGAIPHGMTWDEAAIGYNGFSVWSTRRDEWLRFLPISFQSFGDYKAPAAIYINGFFTLVFGLNLFAIRIPFAMSSVLGIAFFTFLSWVVAKLFNFKKSLVFALLSATLLSLSPWHLHFSRAGFESGMSLAFLIAGTSLLLFYILQTKQKIALSPHLKFFKNPFLLLFLSSGFLVASMYTYHSAKIVAPLIGLLLVGLFFKFWKNNLLKLFFIGLISTLFLLPMAWDSVYGPGATRLGQTSIFSTQDSAIEKSGLFIANFFTHFTPNFLIFGETPNLRHGTGEWGVLFPTTLAGIVLSLSFVFIKTKSKSSKQLFFFFISWIIIGILPAALGADEVPHSNRALLALPGFLGLASLGILELITYIEASSLNKKLRGNHGEKNTIRDAVIGSIVLVHGIFFLSFINHYFTTFSAQASGDYQDGYLEAFKIARQYENGTDGKPTVVKIIFSDEYGQPYIYALVARKTSPIYYRGGSLIKYEFKNVDIGDFQRKNTLVVASAQDDDLPLDQADYIVYGGSGEVRFHLYYLE